MPRRSDGSAAELDLDAIIRELELDQGRPLIELCTEVLDEYGYTYVPKDDNELRFTITTTDRVFRSQIIVTEAPHNVVRLWVYPDSKFDNLSKTSLAEFIARLNQNVALGGFGMAWDDNAVFFRNGIHLLDTGTHQAIEDLMSVSAFPLSLYHSASEFLTRAGTNPRAAVEAAGVRLEVLSWDEIGSDAKKLLIHAI